MIYWAVYYFVVGTNAPLPAFTTGPMSRLDAEAVASHYHPGIYAVVNRALVEKIDTSSEPPIRELN